MRGAGVEGGRDGVAGMGGLLWTALTGAGWVQVWPHCWLGPLCQSNVMKGSRTHPGATSDQGLILL